MEIETKELTVLKSQVSKLEIKANEVTIATPEENVAATELKAKLKDIGKTIKERKEAITKPLNTALKSARDLFAPLEAQFEAADQIIGRKLLAYKQMVEAEARAKEKAIADKLEADRLKLEAEVAAGKITEAQAEKKLDTKLEKAEDKIGGLERVENTTRTAHGAVQFRKIKKVRVTDETKIPDKYWVIDMVLVRKDALAGVGIEGCEVYEEEVV